MFIPQRRDYTADLDFNAVDTWNKKGKFVTHFMNSLSAYFPAGERFFLDSVRNYRDQVKHIPGILQAVNGFIGQEVMHGKMHDQYDAALAAKGYPAKKIEKLVEQALKIVQKNTTKKKDAFLMKNNSSILGNRFS